MLQLALWLVLGIVTLGPFVGLAAYCVWLEVRRAQRIKRNIALEAEEMPGFEVLPKERKGAVK